MQLEPGSTIDERYTVEALIGTGGMAVVYRVHHNQLGSLHALKVLTMTSPEIRERLLTEGRLQATLRHPNAVSVTDVVDVRGHPGLVMELVEGPDLEAWRVDHDPTLEVAIELFRGIVSAVLAAHERGLVHRDLKPGNILLERTRNGWFPKVTDFGLAKAFEREVGHVDTRDGMPLGTPCYMAPEQIQDARNVDERADVFSLGCILYWLVTGKRAFEGRNMLEILTNVNAGSYSPPESIRGDLPRNVRQAIAGSLRVDRDSRIASCTELLMILDLEATPMPPEGVRSPPIRRLSDGPVVTVSAPGPRSRRRSRSTPPPPTPRRVGREFAVVVFAAAAAMGVTGTIMVGGTTALFVAKAPEPPEVAVVAPPIPPPPAAPEVTEPPPPVATPTAAPVVAEDPWAAAPPEARVAAPVPGRPCPPGGTRRLGYVSVGSLLRKKPGTIVNIDEDRDVRKDASPFSELVCLLPTGSTVEIREDPAKASGAVWIAVTGDAFTVP